MKPFPQGELDESRWHYGERNGSDTGKQGLSLRKEKGAEERNGNQEFWERRRRSGGKVERRDVGGEDGDMICAFIMRIIHLYVKFEGEKKKQLLLGIRDSGWSL